MAPLLSLLVGTVVFTTVATSPTTTSKPCNTMCTGEFRPVCGTDLNTYSSKCRMEAHNCMHGTKVTVLTSGLCKRKQVDNQDTDTTVAPRHCNTWCDGEYRPLCGTDSITYPNECQLKVHNCLHGTDVVLRRLGPCP